MPWNKEEDLKLKYAYIDGENDAKHKKRSPKRSPKKADHKHTYQNCVIDFIYPKNYPVTRLRGKPGSAIESYCTVCGKISYPIKDKIAEKKFPNISTGYYGYILSAYGPNAQIDKWFEYKEYCDKTYPHFFLEDYSFKKYSHVPM